MSGRFLSAIFAGAIVMSVLLDSCSHTTAPPQQNPIDTVTKTGTVTYLLSTTSLHSVRSGEYYVVWYRLHNATQFKKLLVISSLGSTLSGLLPSGILPDTIDQATITIEPDTGVSTMGSILFNAERNAESEFNLTPQDSGVGDFSTVAGTATFTTVSGDTTRAQHEFYLMQFDGNTPVPSLTNLPKLAPNWSYALWVIDSSFNPVHQFFYGTFLNAAGYSSDSANASYPFPGGYGPPSLSETNGSIEVTVEPSFGLANLKQIGPSTFYVLGAKLPRQVSLGEIVPLENVSVSGLGYATLTFVVN